MDIYLILILILLLLVAATGYWLFRIIKLFRQKKNKRGFINLSILGVLLLMFCWEMRLIPLSITNDFKNKTEQLTGEKFWSWNEFRYDEISVRGEGYTFEIYNLSPEMAEYFENPPKGFFEKYPLEERFKTSKWKKTPISESEDEILDFVTPTYINWSNDLQEEISERQTLVKRLAKTPGAYYAFKDEKNVDFYLISPKEKLIIYINHHM